MYARLRRSLGGAGPTTGRLEGNDSERADKAQCCSKCCTYKCCTLNVVSNVVHTMLYQCGNTVMHVYVGVYVFRTVYHRVVPSFFRLLELSQLSEAIKSVLNKPGGPMQKSEVNKQTFSSLE